MKHSVICLDFMYQCATGLCAAFDLLQNELDDANARLKTKSQIVRKKTTARLSHLTSPSTQAIFLVCCWISRFFFSCSSHVALLVLYVFCINTFRYVIGSLKTLLIFVRLASVRGVCLKRQIRRSTSLNAKILEVIEEISKTIVMQWSNVFVLFGISFANNGSYSFDRVLTAVIFTFFRYSDMCVCGGSCTIPEPIR